jgi:serine-type D-Ala-D-Ala carboxypeptidase (penicillin-binding protein 5/6)
VLPNPFLTRARAGAPAAALLAVFLIAATATPVPAAPQAPVGGPEMGRGTIVVSTGTGLTPLPKIKANSWVIADAGTGQVLAARAAHSKRPPASTLKTLTALTLIPRLDPQGTYRVVDADVRVSGSRVGLLVGEEYTHDELFTALFLPSANDAAGALARANGSMTTTLSQMNAEAQRLGALDTVAKNPSGLDADGQRSSAYDLALIAREGLKNTTFARYASMVTADFPGKSNSSGKRATFEIQTQNRLLRDGYPGAIGVKTGFTTDAGRTFVGAAKRGDRTLIVSLMGISEPTEDAARKLLDWGFVNDGRITAPVGTLVEPQPVAAKPQNQAGRAQQIDAAGSSAGVGGAGGPGALTLGITGLAIVAGAAMIVVAVLNSDAVTRRRIRRRYR